MFSIRLRRADHVRQYSIHTTATAGWEVSLEEDRMLTCHVWYRDWHRVERVMDRFRREVETLAEQGWEVQRLS